MAKTMLPDLKALVVWDETEIDQSVSSRCCVPVYLWSDFMALGESVADAVIDSRLSGVSPGNCSTLIYTSGTTGPPKAVMISHDNVTWVSNILANNYMDLHHNDRIVSYLPLSHIAAQIIDLHVPMNLGACTYFCQPDALKGSLTVTMRDVKPTFFFGVPRVWEKIQEKMVQTGRANGAVKKAIATWAKTQGAEHSSRAQFGGDGGAPCCFGCADKLVFQTIKSVLGLQHSKGNFTAAAPISVDTLNYFASLDIPIYEIFGQSECTGPHTACYPGSWKIGTCGRPIYGSKSYSDPLTKELCYKGRHVFMGYMYMPEQTASTFTNEGFLKSGDIAEFDADNHPKIPGPSGFMNITGRIKELIITAGGENIAPVLIEDNMKATMVALSNCMVIGDKRKYLSMLLTLKTELNPDTSSSDQLAADALFVSKEIGSTATTLIAAAQDPLWAKYLTDGMKKANKKTESNAQIVQKWIILPCDFTEKTGELTPTMKLKRSVVAEKYHDLIEKMYAGDDR
jgi:long-chain-fatty-acid--CoA ligase ACSBG